MCETPLRRLVGKGNATEFRNSTHLRVSHGYKTVIPRYYPILNIFTFPFKPTNMPTKQINLAVEKRNELLQKFGFTPRKLETSKPKYLSEAQQAKLLGSLTAELKTPIILSPAKPIKGKSTLTIFTSLMVDPKWPAGIGQALFSSAYPGAVFAGGQVAFPRIKTGKMHLVEFNVVLNMNVAYNFRVFQYPLGDFQDITIQGPKTTTLTALVPPVDEISGSLELGASIQNRNSKNDNAGWVLHSVRITTTA